MGSEEEAELAGELELPHLPDMLFLHNRLRCAHASGFHLEVRCFMRIAELRPQIISLIFSTVLKNCAVPNVLEILPRHIAYVKLILICFENLSLVKAASIILSVFGLKHFRKLCIMGLKSIKLPCFSSGSGSK
jgi:hypothetical protein